MLGEASKSPFFLSDLGAKILVPMPVSFGLDQTQQQWCSVGSNFRASFSNLTTQVLWDLVQDLFCLRGIHPDIFSALPNFTGSRIAQFGIDAGGKR